MTGHTVLTFTLWGLLLTSWLGTTVGSSRLAYERIAGTGCGPSRASGVLMASLPIFAVTSITFVVIA